MSKGIRQLGGKRGEKMSTVASGAAVKARRRRVFVPEFYYFWSIANPNYMAPLSL